MKKKIQLSEENLISLIKRIVLEQTVSPVRTNINYTPPALQQVASLQQKPEVAPPVATGTEDMDDAQSLAQRDAYTKQKLAQQKKNQTRVCAGGYKPPADGNYGLCTQGEDVKKLQTYLGFEGKQIDGYFGLRTLQALKKYNGKDKITKAEIDKLSNKQSVESNTENPQTKQPVQNNAGIVIDVRGLGINQLKNAFVKFDENKNEVILMTTALGAAVYSTTCQLLNFNQIWSITGKKYIDITSYDNLIQKLSYNFCSNTTTNVNVTELIKGNQSQLPKNEQNLIRGNTFRAVIKPDKSIHIVSNINSVPLRTSCNLLKNNIFYKNYGVSYVGKTVKLENLANVVKSNFCPTK